MIREIEVKTATGIGAVTMRIVIIAETENTTETVTEAGREGVIAVVIEITTGIKTIGATSLMITMTRMTKRTNEKGTTENDDVRHQSRVTF